MYLVAASVLLTFIPFTKAIPALAFSPIDTNPLGQPFINAVLPLQPGFSPRFDLFRRQGCPNNSLLCPSGRCCSYDTTCCGSSCCLSGYLCTGGTQAAPCCVAITAASNQCGGSNGNPCARQGDLPCNEINICCPPNNACYYDYSNTPRCSPLSKSPLPPATTPITTPVTTPYITPVITTRPTPITTTPYPYPRPSPSPSPSPTPPSSSAFWTPAAIGGVTGGAIGGIILFTLLICICCRRLRFGSNPHIEEPRVKPLTDSEIAWLIKDLASTQEWQERYTAEANRTRAGEHLDRVSWMKDFGTRAVQLRIQQLKDGGEREKSMWKAGAIGFVPIVHYWGLFRDSTKTFNLVAIDSLGMGNTEKVQQLCKDAKAAASKSSLLATLLPGVEWVGKHAFKEWWADSDLATQLQQEMAVYIAAELGQEAATNLMADLVHLKPIIGQFFSGGRAMWKCDAKMLKALEWLQAVAVSFHLRVFVVNALIEVFPEEFGVAGREKGLLVSVEPIN